MIWVFSSYVGWALQVSASSPALYIDMGLLLLNARPFIFSPVISLFTKRINRDRIKTRTNTFLFFPSVIFFWGGIPAVIFHQFTYYPRTGTKTKKRCFNFVFSHGLNSALKQKRCARCRGHDPINSWDWSRTKMNNRFLKSTGLKGIQILFSRPSSSFNDFSQWIEPIRCRTLCLWMMMIIFQWCISSRLCNTSPPLEFDLDSYTTW